MNRFNLHLVRRHYYSPIPDRADLADSYWSLISDLPGVDVNESAALNLLDTAFPPYFDEFRSTFGLHQVPGSDDFYLVNGSFMAVDAHVYYAFIRAYDPARIVEVGAGNSTRVASRALLRNRERTGRNAQYTVVEPYPSPGVRDLEGISSFRQNKVQDVDLSTFTSLGPNDILFIDSSHVLRSGGDVQYLYLEVLPRLSPGVLVHIHDVSLPKHYPRVYFDNGTYWNEQYLLQAFLAFNSRFEVLWPGNYLMVKHGDRLLRAIPEITDMRREYPSSEPSSFWMRVRPDAK
jgi:hypothetical protein